jgi:cysteine desulfurase
VIRTDNHIYLDYAATTPLDPRVAEVVASHLAENYGNASSVHAFGRKAKVVLEESREAIANSIGAEPAEIFFTSGGTEADNHAITGAALAVRRATGKNHLVVSAIEHHAVLDCVEYLTELGFHVSYVPVDGCGKVRYDELKRQVTPNTLLISVMHANNEVGTIQPIEEISLIAKEHGILFHSDTVQTVGKIPVNVVTLGIDLLAISAHKIYGPKGIGAIYIRKGTTIDALLHGGAQERKNRAGTENVPLIAGFAKAMELALEEREDVYERAAALKSLLIKKLRQNVKNIIVNGDENNSLPHILNVSLQSLHDDTGGESLVMNMDLHGVAVSSGSACTSGSVQPSHVLAAMGSNEHTTRTAVRFSFGKYTTKEEVERAGDVFCSIAQ